MGSGGNCGELERPCLISWGQLLLIVTMRECGLNEVRSSEYFESTLISTFKKMIILHF